jgi:hypothetical protein
MIGLPLERPECPPQMASALRQRMPHHILRPRLHKSLEDERFHRHPFVTHDGDEAPQQFLAGRDGGENALAA